MSLWVCGKKHLLPFGRKLPIRLIKSSANYFTIFLRKNKLVPLGGLLAGLDLVLDDEKSLWNFLRQWIMNGTGSVLMWSGNSYLADALSIHFPWTKNSTTRLIVTVLATIIYTFLA